MSSITQKDWEEDLRVEKKAHVRLRQKSVDVNALISAKLNSRPSSVHQRDMSFSKQNNPLKSGHHMMNDDGKQWYKPTLFSNSTIPLSFMELPVSAQPSPSVIPSTTTLSSNTQKEQEEEQSEEATLPPPRETSPAVQLMEQNPNVDWSYFSQIYNDAYMASLDDFFNEEKRSQQSKVALKPTRSDSHSANHRHCEHSPHLLDAHNHHRQSPRELSLANERDPQIPDHHHITRQEQYDRIESQADEKSSPQPTSMWSPIPLSYKRGLHSLANYFPWSALKNYSMDDYVFCKADRETYISLVNTNVNWPPKNNPSKWRRITQTERKFLPFSYSAPLSYQQWKIEYGAQRSRRFAACSNFHCSSLITSEDDYSWAFEAFICRSKHRLHSLHNYYAYSDTVIYYRNTHVFSMDDGHTYVSLVDNHNGYRPTTNPSHWRRLQPFRTFNEISKYEKYQEQWELHPEEKRPVDNLLSTSTRISIANPSQLSHLPSPSQSHSLSSRSQSHSESRSQSSTSNLRQYPLALQQYYNRVHPLHSQSNYDHYSQSTVYNKNDYVFLPEDGETYISLVSYNHHHFPKTHSSHWRIVSRKERQRASLNYSYPAPPIRSSVSHTQRRPPATSTPLSVQSSQYQDSKGHTNIVVSIMDSMVQVMRNHSRSHNVLSFFFGEDDDDVTIANNQSLPDRSYSSEENFLADSQLADLARDVIHQQLSPESKQQDSKQIIKYVEKCNTVPKKNWKHSLQLENADSIQCPICYSSEISVVREFPCPARHACCHDCCIKVLEQKLACPFCRHALVF
jgi:hypothetical protein